MEELDNFKRFLAEEDKKIELNENPMDGPVQHHIEQIEDDLSYGEFGTIEEVVGYLDAIIAGIQMLKITQTEIFDDEESEYGRLRGEMEDGE